jgi:hypothetical protein
MKGKSDFVGIKVSIDQEKNIDQLKTFFLGELEAHLGNLEFFGPILCLYIIFDIS